MATSEFATIPVEVGIVRQTNNAFIELTHPAGTGTFWVNADHITLVLPTDPNRGPARSRVHVASGQHRHCIETVAEVMALIARTYEN